MLCPINNSRPASNQQNQLVKHLSSPRVKKSTVVKSISQPSDSNTWRREYDIHRKGKIVIFLMCVLRISVSHGHVPSCHRISHTFPCPFHYFMTLQVRGDSCSGAPGDHLGLRAYILPKRNGPCATASAVLRSQLFPVESFCV